MDMSIEDLRRLTAHQYQTNQAIRVDSLATALQRWLPNFRAYQKGRNPTAEQYERRLRALDYDWSLAYMAQDFFPMGSMITRAKQQAMVVANETGMGGTFGDRPLKIRFLIASIRGGSEAVELSPWEAIQMLDAKMLEPIPYI